MNACLNPYQSHFAPETTDAIACPDPRCGFLLAGATIEDWQISSLLMQSPVADLYVATAPVGKKIDPPRVLVKVLRAVGAGSLSRLDRLMGLKHPHIQPLQGIGWTGAGGTLYLLSKYEERGSLARYLGIPSHLSPRLIISVVRQIAEALQYAHEQQLVHGRLKPDNCLLVSPEAVRVSDFYRILLLTQTRDTHTAYMAPEQLLGRVEPSTDQYALAVIGYQFLSGQHPFGGTTPEALTHSQRTTPRPLRDFRLDLSARVDDVLGRALSVQPHERFPDVLSFALALQKAVESTVSMPTLETANHPEEPPQLAIVRPNSISRPITGVKLPPPGGIIPLCSLPGHTSAVNRLRWAENGMYLASLGSEQHIRIWNVKQRIGAPIATLSSQSERHLTLSWSPDSISLVSSTIDGRIYLWDIPSSASLTARPPELGWWAHDGHVPALDWSPDGYIVSGGTDRIIRLWDPKGHALTSWQAHGRGGVTSLATAQGGLLASGGADRLVTLWNTTTPNKALHLCEGHTDEIRYLSWSPDSQLLASVAAKKDLRIILWDVQTGQTHAILQGHTREIVGLFWSIDSNWLITASADGTVRAWNTRQLPGEQISFPLPVQNGLQTMAGVSANGMFAMGTSAMLVDVLQFTY